MDKLLSFKETLDPGYDKETWNKNKTFLRYLIRNIYHVPANGNKKRIDQLNDYIN